MWHLIAVSRNQSVVVEVQSWPTFRDLFIPPSLCWLFHGEHPKNKASTWREPPMVMNGPFNRSPCSWHNVTCPLSSVSAGSEGNLCRWAVLQPLCWPCTRRKRELGFALCRNNDSNVNKNKTSLLFSVDYYHTCLFFSSYLKVSSAAYIT